MLHVLNPKLLAALLVLGGLMAVLMPWWQERDNRAAKPKQIADYKAVLALIARYKDDHKGAFPTKLADLEYLLRDRNIAPSNVTSVEDLAERYQYFPPKPDQLEPSRIGHAVVLYQNGRAYNGAYDRCIGMAYGGVIRMPKEGVPDFLKRAGIDTVVVE